MTMMRSARLARLCAAALATAVLATGAFGCFVVDSSLYAVLPSALDGGEPDLGPPTPCTGEGSLCGARDDGLCRSGFCCLGCWDGSVCRAGTADRGCGGGGALCVDCAPTDPPARTCAARTCTDLDECAVGTALCTPSIATCTNTVGGYTCVCAAGFVGVGTGVDGCRYDDPALLRLTVGAGALLSPTFSPDTTRYTVTLPPGAISTSVATTIAFPARATIAVDGVAVASGASTNVGVDLAPRTLTVVVTTETGATRSYALVAARAAATYAKASNTDTLDRFGYAVSLSADGTRLAVGAIHEASSATGVDGGQVDNGAAGSGAVYVFARSGTTWAQEAYLKASNTGANDSFGYSVSLSADGTRLAVGATNEDSSASGVGGLQADNGALDGGAVYVFSRVGTAWTQEAYVKASNTDANDYFGYAVSLSADGTRLVVGARYESSAAIGVGGNEADNSASESGAAYVFVRSGTSWAQEAYLKASNAGAADHFGLAVALSSDGTRLAVGAIGDDSSATGIGGNQADNGAGNAGAVYVFSRTGTTWTQEAYIKASNTGASDLFGTSVALSGDGARLAVGARFEDSAATGVGGSQADNSATESGAAYVFSRTDTTWVQEAYVKASNTGATDYFGYAVSLSTDGARLAVGATNEDSGATGLDGDGADNGALEAGAVYVFSRVGTAWAQDAYVKAPTTDAADFFGYSVSLSGDPSRLAVSAPSEDSRATGVGGDEADNGASLAGAAYLY